MGNQHSKCDDCYKSHLPEVHDRTILPSEAFSEGYVPEFNQASEDELEHKLMSLFAKSAEFGRVFLTSATKEEFAESIRAGALDHQEAAHEAMKLIRNEKLKLLDRLSSHQEDLFWWTGGEYEKTKAVDMRAIAAERELLTKLEAEL